MRSDYCGPHRIIAAVLAVACVPVAARAALQTTLQPTTAIKYYYEVNTDASGDFFDFGMIRMNAGFVLPGGISPSGQVLPIASNDALFTQIGTTFGGDGQINFQLPDLSGRIPIGAGAGAGLTPRSLGDHPGALQNTIGLPQMPITFSGGQGLALNNVQPSFAAKYMIATEGIYPQRDGGGSAGTPSAPTVGQVFLTTAAITSNNLLPCDGRLLPISQYPALFSLLGTTYGGDGQVNFRLPNLSSRAVVGAGNGPGLTPRILGEFDGTESTTIIPSNLPAPFGANVPYNNMQPFEVLQYAISLAGIYPTADSTLDQSAPFLGEIGLFAETFVPAGWAACDGSLLSIAQNQALFSLLGTTYGGNGQTNFQLPDLRGRSAVDISPDFLWGTQTGTETLSLTLSQVPEPASMALVLAAIPLLWRQNRAKRHF